MYHYETARQLLAGIIQDFRVLSGDEVGPSGMTWQQIAEEAAWKLRTLSEALLAARIGSVKDGPVVFPSPDDYVRVVMEKEGYDPIGGGGGHGRGDFPAGSRGED